MRRIAGLEKLAVALVGIGAEVDEQVAGRMAQFAVRFEPTRDRVGIGGDRSHDLLNLRKLNILRLRRTPGEDVVDPEVDDSIPRAGVLRLMLRDLFGIAVQNPARVADRKIDADRQL